MHCSSFCIVLRIYIAPDACVLRVSIRLVFRFVLCGIHFLTEARSCLPAALSISVSTSVPKQVGANGQSHAALFFPSMQAIWPEVYSTNNVRTVEVRVPVCERVCLCVVSVIGGLLSSRSIRPGDGPNCTLFFE